MLQIFQTQAIDNSLHMVHAKFRLNCPKMAELGRTYMLIYGLARLI